jgi:hypothetical protein
MPLEIDMLIVSKWNLKVIREHEKNQHKQMYKGSGNNYNL